MQIFNRFRNKTHPLYRPLKQMWRDVADDKRALAFNLMYDPRVSEKQEQRFLEGIEKCGHNAREFERHRADFNRDQVQGTHTPYFEHSDNEHNRTTLHADPLVTIFLVNGLSRMFLWARDQSEDEVQALDQEFRVAFFLFRTYPNLASAQHDESKRFVNGMMEDRLLRQQFLDTLRSIYEVYSVNFPYHPIWLTKWTDLESCYDAADDNKGRG